MRASKNQWAISPETIMSHHFRLAKGIPHVVDTTPPYSMFNSPISVHYLPKRASSADPFKRKALSKSQRELNDFVNGRHGDPHGLRLPLPIRSSLTDLVKPKLLENRNYQPPRRRPAPKKATENEREEARQRERMERMNRFEDIVLSDLVHNADWSDQMIVASIKNHMERQAGIIPWNDLEEAADRLIEKIGIDMSVLNLKNGRRRSRSRKHERRHQKPPPMPFRVEPIGSRNSLESLSSPSSSSAKTSSSSNSSSSSSFPETNSAASS
uniref:MADF domain-containing protein n=1 Tax=Caenorhabditis tropicalis TaxID=1561998 RepID=A0A1I7UYE6_9PELO